MKKVITIKSGTNVVFLNPDDVLCVSNRNKKVYIMSKVGEYLTTLPLDEVLSCLSDRFISVLKFTFVNYDEVSGFVKGSIVFKNGSSYAIGRDAYSKAKKEFIKMHKQGK